MRKKTKIQALIIMPKRIPSRISQEDLREQAALQLASYQAHERAAINGLAIDQRYRDGAEVESGDLKWDEVARMARSRREKSA